MGSVDISIIVVNYNTGGFLRECLDSLAAAAGDVTTETFVVDNASDDGSPGMVRLDYPEVDLIAASANLGFARACNLAFRRARGQLLLLANPDTVFADNTLHEMVGFLLANPCAGAVGCRLENPDGTLQPSAFRIPTLPVEIAGLLGLDRLLPRRWIRDHAGLRRLLPQTGHFDPHEKVREVDQITGACLMLRAEALEQVGLLDENFFLFYEDIDLCLRLQETGWKILFTPAATVVHHQGQATRANPSVGYRARHFSRLYFFEKHRGWPANLVLKLVVSGTVSLQLTSAIGRRVLGVTPAGAGEVTARDYWKVLRRCWNRVELVPADR